MGYWTLLIEKGDFFLQASFKGEPSNMQNKAILLCFWIGQLCHVITMCSYVQCSLMLLCVRFVCNLIPGWCAAQVQRRGFQKPSNWNESISSLQHEIVKIDTEHRTIKFVNSLMLIKLLVYYFTYQITVKRINFLLFI